MNQEINEVKLNGIDYVRKDSIPENSYPGDVKIVILQRGWVYIGRLTINQENSMCELNSAYCIRRWGTTKGLSELKDGALKDTILDPAGKVVFHILTTIAIISADGDAWKKLIK